MPEGAMDTIRGGHQSLWANNMAAGMLMPVALDGFACLAILQTDVL